ncbi:phage tail protein [Paenibacillus pseudetheri]|nr:phage tail protein [Paenibacillus pseudetheri]
MTITIKGLALQGKAQAGAKLEYTRVAIGDGSLNGQSMPALTGLISQKMVLPITRIRAQPPNKATIGSVVDNSSVTSGFYFREIGLFATDPDVGEILYAYANSGVTADYIPPGGGSDIIEKVFDIDVVIGTAANISAKIDDSLVFTQKKEFLAHVDNATTHITAAERTAWNAAETNAKNASIPLVQKGAAGGVPAMDAAKYMLGDGISLKEFSTETVYTFSFTHNVANQKVDLSNAGALAGFFEVTVTGTFGNQNNVGRMTKRFNIMTNTSGTINSQLTQYTEVTGPIVSCLSISDVYWSASSNLWRITIDARTSNGNGYAVHIKRLTSQATINTKPFTIGTPYTGTAATTLPVAVQTIPDDTKTQSGYLIQKHLLTDNSGKNIKLPNGTDLDTVLANGFYNGIALVNAPTTANVWYYIEVQQHTENSQFVLQRATLMSGTAGDKPLRYERIRKLNVWSTWVEIEGADKKNVANGYAGLNEFSMVPDANIGASIARRATLLNTNALDMNNMTSEGEFYTISDAVAGTYLNMPPLKYAFHLKVSKHAGLNQTITTYGTSLVNAKLRMYSRNFYSGTWGAWVEIENTNSKGVADGYAGLNANGKVPIVNTYSSLAGQGAVVTNMDTLLTAGTYSISNTATGAPEGWFGQALVHNSSGETHDNATNWIWQMFFSTTGNTYVRRKINAGAWEKWVPMWTGYNDSALLVTRSAIANNTDFNSLTTNGVYAMSQATGLLNPPPNVSFGVVIVSRTDGGSPFVKQEATDVVTGNTKTRFRNGSNVWTPWVSNITSGGVGVMEAMLTTRYTGTSYKYANIASYSLGGSTTGTMKITLPVGWTQAMMRIKISGYEYVTGKGAWELLLGGYNFATGWAQTTANIVGNPPFNSVRFAYDGSKCCILLGGVTTAWNFPNVEVSEVLAGHTGASGLGGNWSVAPITVETGITNVLDTPISYGNANTLNGYAPSQTAVPNTIPIRDANKKIAEVAATRVVGSEVQLTTTTATTVATYSVITSAMFTVLPYLRVTAAGKSVTITVNYTSLSGVQAREVLPLTPMPINDYDFIPVTLKAQVGTTITVVATTNSANGVFISATLREEG